MDERPFRERPDEETEAMPTPGDRGAERGDPTEGVRIIGADEAAEVMERGDVAPRRGMGTPKYGDRPAAPPEDARPALRFPLTAGGDPSEVARPRVSGSPGPPMQPWTEPPSGEVPVIVPDAKGDEGTADDLEAWSSFATSGPRWRDQSSDWEAPDYDDTSMLHDDETRVGALDSSDRPPPDDFFSFDEYDDEVAPPPPVPRRVERPGAAVPAEQFVGDRPPPGSSRMPAQPEEWDVGTPPDDEGEGDLPKRLLTAAVLAAGALIVFALGPGPAVVLVTAVVAVCAGELFDSLRRGGYQPATLLGLVASVSMVAAAYWKGEVALPLVLGLTVVFTLLWYLVGVTRVAPTMNLSVTVFGVAYVGLLGSFAALILTFPNGIGVLIGVVVAVAAADAGALFVGRRFGQRLLAPDI
ncbi:MAG: phosphatidate cytidylyltransferase, partial [Actinomycetota bacterium]|nr:phosphatidate cytidylyltransferase [Actinomycetota bacterium]